jgi:hypothetical protein
MRSVLKYAAFAAAVMLIGAAGAGAGSLINGNRIKKGTIPENRLRTSVLKKLNRKITTTTGGVVGAQGGQQGAQGGQGPKGDKGDNGTASYAGPHWGIIDRNTIGSPVGALRSGPFEGTGAGSSPPFGVGSLGFSVKDGNEKVAFGNEVDFAGNPVSGLNAVGFRIFWTGEDKTIFVDNLPNITFEVDPSGPSSATAPNYSSLVLVLSAADVGPTNVWSPYIDGTTKGQWYFTNGTTATTTGCSQSTMCSFSALKTAVAANYPSMSILTAAVSKGRDYAWNGAVDGLRINNQVFDFEPFGVITNSP